MGLRAVSLGHAHPRILAAVYRQMLLGNNFTRPAPIEVECAEALLALVGGEMVKFAKNGSDVTTAAVKLARAYTGRDMVALCADHPFFSTDDWFIGSTPMSAGIPDAIRALTVKFRFNDLESVDELFRRHPGRIACVISEPATFVEPEAGFLAALQETCRRHGALLILDEMITGFRWDLGGAARTYGVDPDLRTFGKAIANGFSVSALVGRREVMKLGGLDYEGDRVFLLSTTHGAECPSLAAALETMAVYREEDVIGGLARAGMRLKQGVENHTARLALQDRFLVLGHPANLIFATRDRAGRPSQVFRTLFLQEMIQRGFITPSFVVSHAHDEPIIDATIAAVGEALEVYRQALDEGPEKYLVGRPVQPVFRRKNRA